MFDNHEEYDHTFWISYTDLVTGFMIIFLIVAFILLSANQTLKGKIGEQQGIIDGLRDSLEIVKQPEPVRDKPGDKIRGKYFELADTFRTYFQGEENIRVTDEGTVQFFFGGSRKYILFPDNDYHMTKNFERLLDGFIDRYYGEIKRIHENQKDNIEIKEIRIEGHTSSSGSYAHNLKLSTLRAYDVAHYILRSDFYRRLDKELQTKIRDNTIAVGYSYTRLLDKEGNLITESKRKEDPDKSRRVEFRLILEEKTNSNENQKSQ